MVPNASEFNLSKSIPVMLVSNRGTESRGEVTLEHFEQKARRARALKMLGILWGIAIVSVLIPLAHFVLVPGFLIAGPLVAFAVYGKESEVTGGSGTCPECGKPFRVERSAPNWPLNDLCSECKSPVKISPLEQ